MDHNKNETDENLEHFVIFKVIHWVFIGLVKNMSQKSVKIGVWTKSRHYACYSIQYSYYALINRECGPFAKIVVVTSCRTDRTKWELYCIPTQVKLQKVSVFLCYYGLKFSRSIRQSVRRHMDRLSANQILAFYPYFVWYTIMRSIITSLLNIWNVIKGTTFEMMVLPKGILCILLLLKGILLFYYSVFHRITHFNKH